MKILIILFFLIMFGSSNATKYLLVSPYGSKQINTKKINGNNYAALTSIRAFLLKEANSPQKNSLEIDKNSFYLRYVEGSNSKLCQMNNIAISRRNKLYVPFPSILFALDSIDVISTFMQKNTIFINHSRNLIKQIKHLPSFSQFLRTNDIEKKYRTSSLYLSQNFSKSLTLLKLPKLPAKKKSKKKAKVIRNPFKEPQVDLDRLLDKKSKSSLFLIPKELKRSQIKKIK